MRYVGPYVRTKNLNVNRYHTTRKVIGRLRDLHETLVSNMATSQEQTIRAPATLDELAQKTRDDVQNVLSQNLTILLDAARGRHSDALETKRLNESLLRQTELQKQLSDVQAELLLLQKQKTESTKTLCEEFASKVAAYEKKVLEASVANAALQKQLEDSKRPTKMLPGQQGTAGELELEAFLNMTLQGFMDIKNVSKIGQGHEMDLQLVSRDGTVHIRIDVKSGTRVPEDEISRFYRDIDGLSPPATGAIVFSKCALRCDATKHEDPTVNVRKSRRGKTLVYQIGCWSREMLIGAIHEIVIRHKVELEAEEAALKPFPGAAEVRQALKSCSNLVAYHNDKAAKAYDVISEWRLVGGEKNRVVADDLRAAHAANGNAVTLDTLTEFEMHVPKRKRGRPPAAEKKEDEKKEHKKDKKRTPLQLEPPPNDPIAVARELAAKLKARTDDGEPAVKKQKVDQNDPP